VSAPEKDMPAVRTIARLVAATLLFASADADFALAKGAAGADLARTTAADTTEPTNTLDYDRGGIFDEVRVSGSGWLQNNDGGKEGPFYIGGEVLFDPFLPPHKNWLANVLLRPRPMIGVNIATNCCTDQIFAGLTWDVPAGPFFLEASFGGTIHDGQLHQAPGESGEELELGCRVLFRESAGIGVNLGRHWTALAGIDHSSNNGFCDDNSGLTHLGGMIGYHF